jgi:hypothetical protein
MESPESRLSDPLIARQVVEFFEAFADHIEDDWVMPSVEIYAMAHEVIPAVLGRELAKA